MSDAAGEAGIATAPATSTGSPMRCRAAVRSLTSRSKARSFKAGSAPNPRGEGCQTPPGVSQMGRLPSRSWLCCASSTVSSAAGSASRRASGMTSPLRTDRP